MLLIPLGMSGNTRPSQWTQITDHISATSMIPPMMNEFAFLLKSSSIVSIAGVPDMMGIGREIIEREYRGFEIILAIGVIYYCLCIGLTSIGKRVENTLAAKMGR